MIVVECPACHRPACGIAWSDGHALIVGLVLVDKNGDRGGIYRNEADRKHRWSARVTSTDSGSPDTYATEGRKTIACTCKRRIRRTVTQAALDASCHRAMDARLSRVSLLDLHE